MSSVVSLKRGSSWVNKDDTRLLGEDDPMSANGKVRLGFSDLSIFFIAIVPESFERDLMHI